MQHHVLHVLEIIFVRFCQIFVSPERSSERDYVITDSVCSMCMYVVCMCMYVVIFAKLITVSAYIHVFPWDLDTMILG